MYESIYQTNLKILELETQLKKEQEGNIQLIKKCQIHETNESNSRKEEIELELNNEIEKNSKLLKKIDELNKIIQKKEAALKEAQLQNSSTRLGKKQEDEIKINEIKTLKDEKEKSKELLDNQKSTINILTESQKSDKILIKKLEVYLKRKKIQS